MKDEENKKDLVERPNKERLKREIQAIKKMVMQLIELPAGKLEGISIDESTCTALMAAKNMERTALKRQIKYITGQMKNENVELIGRELYLLAQPHKEEVQSFHETERWRDALIGGDDDLIHELAERFTAADRQRLRQLVRNARKEKEQGRTPKAARLLFRYLKELYGQS